MLKILVIEDHALIREGLVQTLRKLARNVDVSEAATCEQACVLFDEGHDFDLVLLDLGLPGVDGMACLCLVRQRFPALPVLVVSAYDDAQTVNRALKNGASGFVPKAYSCDRLLAALRKVLKGQEFSPKPMLAEALDDDLTPSPLLGPNEIALAAEFGLTERQAEVLSLMLRGKSNRDIAAHLGTAEGTVKLHVSAIFKALGVNNRPQTLLAVMKYKTSSL